MRCRVSNDTCLDILLSPFCSSLQRLHFMPCLGGIPNLLILPPQVSQIRTHDEGISFNVFLLSICQWGAIPAKGFNAAPRLSGFAPSLWVDLWMSKRGQRGIFHVLCIDILYDYFSPTLGHRPLLSQSASAISTALTLEMVIL